MNLLSDLELVNLQTSKSDWHARRARLILQARAVKRSIGEQATQLLQDIFTKDKNTDYRLRAMWTLHMVNYFNEDLLLEQMNNPDEYIRAWAIQFLCEDKNPSTKALDRLTNMASNETSPVVRLYLAAALQRIPEAARWEVVKGLLTHHE